MSKLLLTTFVLFVLIASGVSGDQAFSALERQEQGVIDWTNRTITAKGSVVPDEKTNLSGTDRQNRLLERSKLNATENLLLTIFKIGLDSKGTAEQFISSNKELMEQVRAMVNNARVVKKEYLTDGSVETTLQLSFDGGFAQLLLPKEIKQIEPVKTLNVIPESSGSLSVKENHGGTKAASPLINTGLVVDARGLHVQPVMSPRLIDESGREVYGPAFISREYAVQYGATEYTKSLQATTNHERTGQTPLIVTGLKTLGKTPSDIVISNTDASKLHGSSTNLAFLNACRVIIVID